MWKIYLGLARVSHHGPIGTVENLPNTNPNPNPMSLNHEKYNVPFTASKLLDALHKSHDTAAGPDDIHYQILKHLPDNALETLLDILNI